VADVASVGGLESAAPAGEPGTAKFPALDGYRAIAALAVLVTHVTFISQANRMPLGSVWARLDSGVAVFFLLSGFLLYRPFVAARLRAGPAPGVRPYLWRRVLRIYPAYWLVLTIAVVVFHVHHAGGWTGLVSFYGLVHIYRVGTVLGPLPQSWTLATELSFYLFLPAWAALMARGRRRVAGQLRRELAGVALLYGVSVAYRLAVLASGTSPATKSMLGTWLIAWLDLFAMGMLLAVISAWREVTRRGEPTVFEHRWAPAACWAAAALCFYVVCYQVGLPQTSLVYTSAEQMLRQLLYGLTGFFLLLPGIFGPRDGGLIRRFLASRVLTSLGLISYGIYLWHEVWLSEWVKGRDLVVFNTAVLPLLAVVLAGTVASAAASFVLLERPILRLKSWGPGRSR
jgi:peptidoglycan/LPS O-acetylase OafA/YrhL